MANDYLKHYGVKKSQWSPQARARYDAEHRRKYGTGEPVTPQGTSPNNHLHSRKRNDSGKTVSLLGRDEIRSSKKPKNLVRTNTSSNFVTTRKLTKGEVNRAPKSRLNGQIQKVDISSPVVGANTRMNGNKVKGASNARNAGGSMKREPTRSKSALGNRQDVPLARPTSSSGGKGKPTSGSKHIGNGVAQQPQSTGASLPKAGFIFKRPQARTVGKALYNATKKEAHKVKKRNDNQKEAQDAFERHKREAEKAYEKQQKDKEKKKKQAAKEDKKAVDAYNRNLERNARNYKRRKYEVEDFFGRKKTITYKDMKESKNPFDRISVDYKPIKTSDNKLVRFAKKAYNELGFDYNSTPKQEREGHKRWKENEKRKQKLRKEYEKQKKAREKEYEKQQKARQKSK